MQKTLLVMAAGMGSRYGGNKQIDGMGPHNEILMMYSVFDAVKAGFDKVVFVIKHDFEEMFRERFGDPISKKVRVEYVFQEMNDIPEGCHVPAERTKPLGTVQAVLAARNVISEPFAVVNADDYYGVSAFKTMADHLDKLRDSRHSCMVGYYLKNTVSEHGHVTRGVCDVDESGCLSSIKETYKITLFPDGTIRDTAADPAGVLLDPDGLVSMNFFGFTPWIFGKAENDLAAFLKGLPENELKAEYVLPTLVDQLMHEEKMAVDVLSTDAVWFGVTYKEDKPYVQAELKKMHDEGVYPETLF
ncbi:MAG: sugar phosphate nucleotidyltransferase [Clostridia bacterium]|nr:sugar phosphate nucleotidyltransferase [Clostridia bacterium]